MSGSPYEKRLIGAYELESRRDLRRVYILRARSIPWRKRKELVALYLKGGMSQEELSCLIGYNREKVGAVLRLRIEPKRLRQIISKNNSASKEGKLKPSYHLEDIRFDETFRRIFCSPWGTS